MEILSFSKLNYVQTIKIITEFLWACPMTFSKIHLETEIPEVFRNKPIWRIFLKTEINTSAVKKATECIKEAEDLKEQILVAEH